MPAARATRELQIIDPVLTNLARQYRPQGSVYDDICPSIPVELLSGQYPIYDSAYFFGDDTDNKVSDRAETPEIDFKWSTDQYLAEDYRLKVSISPRERRQAGANDNALRFEASKLALLLDRMATRRERRLAAQLRHTDNGGQLTGGKASPSVKWLSANDSATIEQDIKTGRLATWKKTGMFTNTIVLGFEVAYEMALQSDIREIIKFINTGQQPGSFLELGDRVLPNVLHGHRVVVANRLVNTAREGAAMSLSEVWDDHVRLIYVNPNAAWGQPSTCYAFKAPVGSAEGTSAAGQRDVVDRWVTPDPPVDYIRAWETVDEKVCAPDLGYELYDVLA
jgi:hypothetical protein